MTKLIMTLRYSLNEEEMKGRIRRKGRKVLKEESATSRKNESIICNPTKEVEAIRVSGYFADCGFMSLLLQFRL